MATQTTNLHLAKPDYSDAADIAVINGNMDTIDAVSGSVIQTIVGSTNTTGHTINSGEYFVANGSKYKATASIPNGSAWSGSATAVSDHDLINSLNNNTTPSYTLSSKISLTPNSQGMNISRVGKILSFKLYFTTNEVIQTYTQLVDFQNVVFATGQIHEVVNILHEYVGNAYSDMNQHTLNAYTTLATNTDYIVSGVMLLK